jgi:flagellar biosynthetic protein FliR
MILSEPEIAGCVAVLTRAGGLAVSAPLVGDPGTPARVRLVFVVGIAFALGPSRQGLSYAALPTVVILEAAIGLVTGVTARFVLSRVAVAGQLLGLHLGLGFASEYDHRAGESAGTVRTLVMTLAGLAFLGVGGLEAIVRSVAAGPAHATQLALLGPMLLHHGTTAFGAGLALAAPVVLAAVVGNLGLAVLNRAAPAVNVFSISLAGVLVLGGMVLRATAPNLIASIVEIARTATHALLGQP